MAIFAAKSMLRIRGTISRKLEVAPLLLAKPVLEKPRGFNSHIPRHLQFMWNRFVDFRNFV